MALIDCPECKSQISDRAKFCPQCGFPIQEEFINIQEKSLPSLDEIYSTDIAEINSFSFSGIGRQVTNWLGDGVLKDGSIDVDDKYIGPISSGKVTVYRHKEGIKLRNGLLSAAEFDIHYGQIIDVEERTAEEIVHTEKSVIGRGVAGGLLLGPAAAVVGALSALNTSSLKKLSILRFVFFDLNDGETKEFYIRVKKGSATLFLMATRKMIAELRPLYAKTEQLRAMEYLEENNPKVAARVKKELDKKNK